MDSLTDYDECVRIETARCDLRDQCQTIAPEHFEEVFGDFDHDTCLAYAKENCRVREIAHEGWKEQDIENCINAIKDLATTPGQCARLNPRTDETEALQPACWFIREEEIVDQDTAPPDAGSDSGNDPPDSGATEDAGPDSG